jgi:hypothetical protein
LKRVGTMQAVRRLRIDAATFGDALNNSPLVIATASARVGKQSSIPRGHKSQRHQQALHRHHAARLAMTQ